MLKIRIVAALALSFSLMATPLAVAAEGSVDETKQSNPSTVSNHKLVPNTLSPSLLSIEKQTGEFPSMQCRLPQANSQSNVSIALTESQDRVRPVGDLNYLVIFVDFANLPSTRTVRSMIPLISPASEREFAVDSYGKLKLKYQFMSDWIRMPKNSNQYSFVTYKNHHEYVQDALMAVNSEIDFSKIDGVVILTDPAHKAFPNGPSYVANSGWGVNIDGVEIRNAITSGADLSHWGPRWANHEIGHNLGLPDLYSYYHSYPDAHKYVGEFGYMGLISGKSPGFFAYEKWLLGWVTDKQVICQPKIDRKYFLSSLGKKIGKKVLLTPLGANQMLAVEYRTPTGLDAEIGTAGLLVYVVDSSKRSGEGAISVVKKYGSIPNLENSLLSPGESITVGDISVEFSGTRKNRAVVKISKG